MATDLRRFILVKGVERKLHVVKELVVQQAMLRLKQQQAGIKVNVETVFGKLVIQNVVGVEMQFDKATFDKHAYAGALPGTPRPPTPTPASSLFSTGALEFTSSFRPGLTSSEARRQALGTEERIIMRLENLNNDTSNAPNNKDGRTLDAEIGVVKQRFVRAFGAPEHLNMGESMSSSMRTLTNDGTEATGEEQCFAAGTMAAAARAAATTAPIATAAEQETAQLYGPEPRLLRGTPPLALLSSSASSSVSQAQQQQDQTVAKEESWHHWQASAEDKDMKQGFKPDQLQEMMAMLEIVLDAMKCAVALRDVVLRRCAEVEEREPERERLAACVC